jgi:hypothetical protein
MPVDMSITALLYALGFCAIVICVALIIQWGIKWLGCPEQPARLIMVIVWIIVGLTCIDCEEVDRRAECVARPQVQDRGLIQRARD